MGLVERNEIILCGNGAKFPFNYLESEQNGKGISKQLVDSISQCFQIREKHCLSGMEPISSCFISFHRNFEKNRSNEHSTVCSSLLPHSINSKMRTVCMLAIHSINFFYHSRLLVIFDWKLQNYE